MEVEVNRLVRQKHRIRKILNIQRDISFLEEKLSGPSGMIISDMPKSQKPTPKVEMLVARKISKMEQLEDLKKVFKKEDAILRDVIRRFENLPEPKSQEDTIIIYQDILIYYYLQDWSMKDIYKIFAGSGKFKENSDEDSNMKKLYRKHNRAIDFFQICQIQKKECVSV